MQEALEEIKDPTVGDLKSLWITEDQYQAILNGEWEAKGELNKYTNLVKWIIKNKFTLNEHQLTLEDARKKYRLARQLRAFMEEDPERFKAIKLAEDRYDFDTYPYTYKYTKFFSESFLWLINSLSEFKRMVTLYEEVAVRYRVPHSSKQVDLTKVALVANTPNFNRLPKWVRHSLVKYAPISYLNSGRLGNVWDLPTCCKAWKWQPLLPKKIAFRIGLMSPKYRMLAYWAWQDVSKTKTRQQQEEEFWGRLRALSHTPVLTLTKNFCELHQYTSLAPWGRLKWTNFLELVLALPKYSLDLPKDLNYAGIEEAVMPYLDMPTLLQHLFGCAGKATEKAFRQSDKCRISWAGAIGKGNPDLVQKILLLPECIPFYKDTVEFLQSLDSKTAVRLLQSNKFRYRGEIHPVSDDLIRDSGYLWSNIQQKPELGRIRCWFSLHTQLAAEYVKELPDEAIKIPYGWERIQGLSAIDKSWEIEFPTSVATLKYWGQVLHNCVGGYGKAIESGRSVVFVVKEGGHPTHCVEIAGHSAYSPGQVNQFHGNHNGYPDYALKEAVLNVLREAKLVE